MAVNCLLCDRTEQGWVGDRPWKEAHFCVLCAFHCKAWWTRDTLRIHEGAPVQELLFRVTRAGATETT